MICRVIINPEKHCAQARKVENLWIVRFFPAKVVKYLRMAIDLQTQFKDHAITRSEHFLEIMQKYDAFGRHMSLKSFWSTYIQVMDPTISYRQWYYFMGKLDKMQRAYVKDALEKSNARALEESQLEQNSLKNILKISDISMAAVAENPDLIHTIPLTTRMRWFFQAMKARDSRAKTNLAKASEERQQSLFEKMMEGAQYGGFDVEQIPVVESEAQEVPPGKNAETKPISYELPGSL